MLAAAAAGVAIPSQTLARLNVSIPMCPEALKRFRAAYPVRFTHDEDGTRLTETSVVATDVLNEAEDEDELVLAELDD